MEDETLASVAGHQIKVLINTHSQLVEAGANVAARKIRYGIMNYMESVASEMALLDGGRRMPATAIDPQIDIVEQIALEEAEAEVEAEDEVESAGDDPE